jgi:hypothetical protein
VTDDYHKRKTIAFRAETEADEQWLDHLAESTGETMNAVMRRIVRDARLASERPGAPVKPERLHSPAAATSR